MDRPAASPFLGDFLGCTDTWGKTGVSNKQIWIEATSCANECFEKRQHEYESHANAIADLGYGFEAGHVTLNQCPCLTRSHSKTNSYYSFSRQRKLTTTEVLRLQGINPERVLVPDGVDEKHIREMCGNSFSVLYFKLCYVICYMFYGMPESKSHQTSCWQLLLGFYGI